MYTQARTHKEADIGLKRKEQSKKNITHLCYTQ